jgi:putative oxidoreductase
MSGLVYALGRILVPIVFIVSGYGKFMTIGPVAKMLADKNVPAPMQLEAWTGMPRYEVLGYAAASIEVLCGMMVLIGFKARFAAVVLFLFTLGTILIQHNIWTVEGVAQVANQLPALKDLAIMGALLMIAAAGSGSLSFDRRPRSA